MLRAFIIITIIVATLFYGLLLFNQSLGFTLNASGRAFALAVNIAFGQDPVFQKQAEFASLLPEDLTHCRIKNQRDLQYCHIATPYGGSEKLFYRRCAWWRFEQCAFFTIDPAILEYAGITQALTKIVSKPCRYLPAGAEIQDRLKQSAEQAKRAGIPDLYSIELKEYLHARTALQCDQKSNLPVPVLWGAFPITSESKTHRALALYGN